MKEKILGYLMEMLKNDDIRLVWVCEDGRVGFSGEKPYGEEMEVEIEVKLKPKE